MAHNSTSTVPSSSDEPAQANMNAQNNTAVPPFGARATPPINRCPPWLLTDNLQPCPPWLEHLNRVYIAKAIPPGEMDRFRQLYSRDAYHCRMAVELFEGRRMPSEEKGFAPLPDPRNSNEPGNTTVFVGGLVGRVSPDLLQAVFLPFGPIEYAKCPEGKGCGFVKFAIKKDAEWAIARMQGFALDKSVFRTSWASTGAGIDRSPPGGGLNPEAVRRLGHYIDVATAERVLSALDAVFDGNLAKLKEGLEFLSIGAAPAAAPVVRQQAANVSSCLPVGRGGISPYVDSELRAHLESNYTRHTPSHSRAQAKGRDQLSFDQDCELPNASLNVNAPVFEATPATLNTNYASFSPLFRPDSFSSDDFLYSTGMTMSREVTPSSDADRSAENHEVDASFFRDAPIEPVAQPVARTQQPRHIANVAGNQPPAATGMKLSTSAPIAPADITRQRVTVNQNSGPRRSSDPADERFPSAARSHAQSYPAFGPISHQAAKSIASTAHIWTNSGNNRYGTIGNMGNGIIDNSVNLGARLPPPFIPRCFNAVQH